MIDNALKPILISRYVVNEGNISNDEYVLLASCFGDLQSDSIIDTLKGFWPGLRTRFNSINEKIWNYIWVNKGESEYKRGFVNTATGINKVVVPDNSYAKAYFQRHGMELVKTMSATDIKRFKTFIGNPDVWGNGLPNFERILGEDWGVSRARSKLILENELHEAYIHGQDDYIKNEYPKTKHPDAYIEVTWRHSHRTKPRPMHIAIDFETIKYGGSFSNGLKQPGGPNCQCHLEYNEKLEYKQA